MLLSYAKNMTKTMSVGELKANFSRVLDGVEKGDSYIISYGKTKKEIAAVVPIVKKNTKKMKFGTLSKMGSVKISKNFKITTEEFLNL